MPADHLILVRHAMPKVDMDVSSNQWALSEEGLEAAHRLGLFLQVDCGSKIWSSDEIKAKQTASQIARVIGNGVGIDPRLAEVTRPTTGDEASYRERAIDYLRGFQVEDWEPRSEALERFSEAIDELLMTHDGEHLVVVDHGLIMTLYIASTEAPGAHRRKEPIDPIEFWKQLEFPDAWRIDLKRNWLDRIGFTWDGLPISIDPPHGAAALVYRWVEGRIEFLLLHRSSQPQKGDWAWTPPAGARFPGEDIKACAMRELKEETGLELRLIASNFGSENWSHFLAEAPVGCEIRLSEEHDEWEWVEGVEACERCLPVVVSDPLRRALEHLRSHV